LVPKNIISERINLGSRASTLEYPDFLDIQLESFRQFFQLETTPENRSNEGLYKVFSENFPITDTRNQFVLEFLDYFIDPPRYTIEECIERGLTYSVPLKGKTEACIVQILNTKILKPSCKTCTSEPSHI
jgi:DNA-directed RNA polymerase subunit beta